MACEDAVSKSGWRGGCKWGGAKLIWVLQQFERSEFDTWHGMKMGLHGAPLGVRAACMAAVPALQGGTGLPALPLGLVECILEMVVTMGYKDYVAGPTGARAVMVGPCPVGAPNVGLHGALMRCKWCDGD